MGTNSEYSSGRLVKKQVIKTLEVKVVYISCEKVIKVALNWWLSASVGPMRSLGGLTAKYFRWSFRKTETDDGFCNASPQTLKVVRHFMLAFLLCFHHLLSLGEDTMFVSISLWSNSTEQASWGERALRAFCPVLIGYGAVVEWLRKREEGIFTHVTGESSTRSWWMLPREAGCEGRREVKCLCPPGKQTWVWRNGATIAGLWLSLSIIGCPEADEVMWWEKVPRRVGTEQTLRLLVCNSGPGSPCFLGRGLSPSVITQPPSQDLVPSQAHQRVFCKPGVPLVLFSIFLIQPNSFFHFL